MKIAIDTRELNDRPTGVGRLLQALLAEWKTLPAAAAHEFVPYAGHGTAWEQLALPRMVRRDGADLLFCPAYSGPVTGSVTMVVAIHDVSFAAHPEWFGWREGLRRRVLARLSAQRARRVVTISEFSKAEIVQRLGVDAGKIDVAYPGFTRMNVPRASPTSEQLILYVGSLFNRRNIPELMTAFAHLSRERAHLRLEIVGDNRSSPRVDFNHLAEATGAGDRITLRSYVSDAELASLYGRARAFVFLSSYEGFGLTPLEALAAGVPSVVLDTPVAREIYGAAALYVPRPDPDLVQAAISRVLFDEAERARILDAAPSILQRYSWRTFAERVLDSLVAAADI
jgi:glycosyltransferase involved in cell wall biosynthesis